MLRTCAMVIVLCCAAHGVAALHMELSGDGAATMIRKKGAGPVPELTQQEPVGGEDDHGSILLNQGVVAGEDDASSLLNQGAVVGEGDDASSLLDDGRGRSGKGSGKCDGWCSKMKFQDKTLKERCGWKHCSGCGGCAQQDAQSPGGGGGGGDEGDDDDDDSGSGSGDEGDDDEGDDDDGAGEGDDGDSGKCEGWCNAKKHQRKTLEERCSWKQCNGCKGC